MGKVSQMLDFALKAILIATAIFASQAMFDKALSVHTLASVALSVAFAAFLSCMLNLDSFNRVPFTENTPETTNPDESEQYSDLLHDAVTNILITSGCLALLFVILTLIPNLF